jgi:hypothetical protein
VVEVALAGLDDVRLAGAFDDALLEAFDREDLHLDDEPAAGLRRALDVHEGELALGRRDALLQREVLEAPDAMGARELEEVVEQRHEQRLAILGAEDPLEDDVGLGVGASATTACSATTPLVESGGVDGGNRSWSQCRLGNGFVSDSFGDLRGEIGGRQIEDLPIAHDEPTILVDCHLLTAGRSRSSSNPVRVPAVRIRNGPHENRAHRFLSETSAYRIIRISSPCETFDRGDTSIGASNTEGPAQADIASLAEVDEVINTQLIEFMHLDFDSTINEPPRKVRFDGFEQEMYTSVPDSETMALCASKFLSLKIVSLSLLCGTFQIAKCVLHPPGDDLDERPQFAFVGMAEGVEVWVAIFSSNDDGRVPRANEFEIRDGATRSAVSINERMRVLQPSVQNDCAKERRSRRVRLGPVLPLLHLVHDPAPCARRHMLGAANPDLRGSKDPGARSLS